MERSCGTSKLTPGHVLAEIYDSIPAQEVRVGNNGSWVIEQYIDKDFSYQARILPNGEIYVSVFTLDKFPKLVADFQVVQVVH